MTTPPTALRCEPDAALIDEGRACRIDDQCPCGSHCTLGRCAAQCKVSSECGDEQACDVFGRCRGGDTESVVAPRNAPSEGRPRILQAGLVAAPRDAPSLITIVADDGSIKKLRVIADPGFEVALPVLDEDAASLTYTAELVSSAEVSPGRALNVYVRPVADIAAAETYPTSGVTVVTESNQSAAVTIADASTYAEPTFLAPPLRGRYEGHAKLSLSGVQGPAGFEGVPPARNLSTIITAEVYGTSGGRAVIVLQDPLRILHPAGTWVGEVVLDGTPHVEMPAFEQLPSTPVAASTIEVVTVANNESLALDPGTPDWPGSLSFALDLSFEGASHPRQKPRQVWTMTLGRTGDLPADAVAPALDVPAVLGFDAAVAADTALPHEAAVYEALAVGSELGDAFRVVRGWRNQRAQVDLSCQDLVDGPLIGGDLSDRLGKFAYEPMTAPRFNNLRDADLGVRWILEVDDPADSAVPWSQFSGLSGRAVDLQAPLLAAVIPGLSKTGAQFFDPTDFRVVLGQSRADYEVQLLDGTIVDSVVPCAWDLRANAPGAIALSGGGQIDVDLSAISIDVCEAMAAIYQCQRLPLAGRASAAARVAPNASISIVGDGNAATGVQTSRGTLGIASTLVDEVCVFPRRPSTCVERALCDDVSRPDPFAWTDLGPTVDPVSGDLGCADTARGLWLDASTTQPSSEVALAACLADLSTFDDAPGAMTGAGPRARLTSLGWDEPSSCINPLRFISTLALAGSHARELGRFGLDRDVDTSDVIFLRLLQQYLQLRGFVASQGLSAAPLAAEFAPGGTPAAGLQSLEAALVTSIEGWDLLLHPRIASSIAGMAPSALFDPDYRTRILSEASPFEPYHSQGRGLVVTMMSVLATQMELVDQVIGRHARAGLHSAPESTVRALRVVGVIQAQIAMLSTRARSANPLQAPAWLADFERARGRFYAAQSRAHQSLNSLVRGANPLGIQDDDLPLYFSQVRTDAGSRYTAISDYILGDGTGAAPGIAQQAVDVAAARFAAARSGYETEKARRVNEDNASADLAERVLLTRIEHGSAIQDACGEGRFSQLSPPQISDLYVDSPAQWTIDPDGRRVRDRGAIDFRTCWFRHEDPDCLEDQEFAAANMNAELLDAQLAEQLKATVEANAKNSLCIAALAGATEELPRCDDTLEFSVLNGTSTGGCLWDFDIAVGFDTCSAPNNNPSVMPSGGSAGLLRLQAQVLGSSAILPELTQTFVPANAIGFACDGFPTQTKKTRYVNFGAGSNRCTNVSDIVDDQGSLRGFMPEVVYDPGTPEAPVPANRRMRLECDLGGETFTEYVTNRDLARSGGLDKAAVDAATAQCDRLFPRAFVANTQPAQNFEVTKSHCYRGALGAQAATLRALVAEIKIANSELAVMRDEYRISMEGCFILQRGNNELIEAESAFRDEMIRLNRAKVAMASAALVAEGVKECATAGNAAAEADPAVILNLTGAGVECAAVIAEKALKVAAEALDAAMTDLQAGHEVTRLKIQSATAEKLCFNEAELSQVGARTLDLNILLALQNMEAGYADFVNAVEEAELTALRGLDDITIAEASGALTVGADPWLNADIAGYGRAMRVARRAAYLAVRAVEYEFQMSTGITSQVLLAEGSGALQTALTELRSISNTPSPNGNQPAELTEVFSLRDHLLQLAPRDAVPPGEIGLSAAERFRIVLQDPRFAVHDDGAYVGQEIPFRIAPLKTIALGSSTGIPVVANNSCAERLWSLNVSIQGDPAKSFKGFAPQVNLEVRKRNTFFANWCDDNEGGFQVASTRPSKNLFREPGIAEGFTGAGGTQTNLFSKARIQALLNVPVGDFLTDAYVDGASTELASRLLFGDYTLFIPAESIARFDATGAAISNGLILSGVDDIAIRMDYLSVAR